MRKEARLSVALAIVYTLLYGCGSQPKPTKAASPPPAKVENRVKESDLTRVTLSPDAEKRLGVELALVTERTASNQMRISGDVIAIPGKSLIVTAPASGAVVLARKDIVAGQPVSNGQTIFRLTPMLPPQR